MGPQVLLNASVPWMDEFNSLNQALGTDHHHWWLLLCFTSSVKLLGLGIGRKRMGKGCDGYSSNGTDLFLSREGKAKLSNNWNVELELCIWPGFQKWGAVSVSNGYLQGTTLWLWKTRKSNSRSQLYLHCRNHRSIKEAATTGVPLENLPCALVAGEPWGHTEHLQGRIFLTFRGDPLKPSPFFTVTGCEGSACSQDLHAQGTFILLQTQEGSCWDWIWRYEPCRAQRGGERL